MTVMLYKHPGVHEIHGDKFDYVIVDEKDVDEAIAAGWRLTTTDAKEVKPKKTRKPRKSPEDTDDGDDDGVD